MFRGGSSCGSCRRKGRHPGTATCSVPPAWLVTAIGAGDHVSGLQACPLRGQPGARRRRRRDRGDRGHLQLLRGQGEDRHRPSPRGGTFDRALGGRGDRSRHDRRVRLAHAVARRRRSPDRRHEEGGARDLRVPARALQPRAGRARDRRRGDRHRAGGRGAGRRRRAGTADAGGLRLGDDRHVRAPVGAARRRGRRRRRSHHRGPVRAPGGEDARPAPDRHPARGPSLDARGATSASPDRERAGAAPTSTTR